MAPSGVLSRLRELFPNLKQDYVGLDPTGIENEDFKFITSPRQAARHLVSRLRLAQSGQKLAPVWAAVWQFLASRPETENLLEQALSGLKHKNQLQPLPPALVRTLYGRRAYTSVTRLEQFAACPFKHFAYNGLNLRAVKSLALIFPSLGLFTHAILNRVTLRLVKENRGFDDLKPEETVELVKHEVEKTVPSFASGVLKSSPLPLFNS